MKRSGRFFSARHVVTLLGATLVVAGAGVALARTSSGPPWESPNCAEATADATAAVPDAAATTHVDGDAGCVRSDPSPIGKVQNPFVGNDCGTAAVGTADLSNAETAEAFDALATALDSGQKDHMVQSVRVLMANCADHPNDGLKNALYHHGLNWVRHYEHEQWLQQKFADKWPDGKPGKAGGKPEAAGGKPDEIHGNPHDLGVTGDGQGHQNDQVEGS